MAFSGPKYSIDAILGIGRDRESEIGMYEECEKMKDISEVQHYASDGMFLVVLILHL